MPNFLLHPNPLLMGWSGKCVNLESEKFRTDIDTSVLYSASFREFASSYQLSPELSLPHPGLSPIRVSFIILFNDSVVKFEPPRFCSRSNFFFLQNTYSFFFYFQQPTTREEWLLIQEQFLKKWHFPQCLGALDGKHVRVRCPSNGGSGYYNYLGYHSLVLFALVDAKYKFLYYEVGAPGRVGDATIWNNSPFKAALESHSLPVPDPRTTPNSNTPIPSLIVADSAFALSAKLMKPYSDRGSTREQRVFNYRLSRARRIVENAFGILAARFGVYQRAMLCQPSTVKKIILATLTLHNFLRVCKDQQYAGNRAVDAEVGENHELVLGDWRNNANALLDGLQPTVGGIHGNRRAEATTGAEVRNTLCHYFSAEGAVPWQNRIP